VRLAKTVLIPILAGVVLLTVASLDIIRVSGLSMEHTLYAGDVVVTWRPAIVGNLVNLDAFFFSRDAMVVCRDPWNSGRLVLKRIIATPGDSVKIVDGAVSVNGSPRVEPAGIVRRIENWPAANTGLQYVTVPAEHYFVMGDNRLVSMDSRDFGSVRKDAIVGRVFFTWRRREAAPFSSQ
jgi:signal peptidase I